MKLLQRSAAALACILLAQFGRPEGLSAAFRNVQIGQAVLPFSLRDLDGRQASGEDLLEGRVGVIVFFATWSPRSQEILADLEHVRAEVGAEKLRIVGVNVEHEVISDADRDAIRAFVSGAGSGATVLLDEGLVVFNAYGTMAVPSSLVVGADGKVLFALAGYPLSQRSDLADAVRSALGLPTTAGQRPPQEYVPKNHALMHYNFARLLLAKAQEEKALHELEIAIERDPGFAKPWIELGLLRRRRGEFEEARSAFLEAGAIDPHDPEPAYQAAVAGLRAGHLEEAEAGLAALSAEFPDRGAYALALALARGFLGDESGRRAGVERAAGLIPPEPRVLRDLGEIAESRGDLALAAELYRRALATLVR